MMTDIAKVLQTINLRGAVVVHELTYSLTLSSVYNGLLLASQMLGKDHVNRSHESKCHIWAANPSRKLFLRMKQALTSM